jgi:ABC-type Fe3+/spermidine/putrescine transport system ATPase subunit
MIAIRSSGGDLDADFNLAIKGSTIVVGSSGSGKTTLLRAIAGLYSPAYVSVFGEDVSIKLGPDRNVSYAWQDKRLMPNKNVWDNIRLGGAPDEYLLHLFNLVPLVERMPSSLSGGEQQRVNLVRAASSGARVILLDEPMQGIDPSMERRVLEPFIEHLHKDGKLVIMVTHDLRSVFGMFEYLVHVESRSAKCVDKVHEMYAEPSSMRIAEMFGTVFTLCPRDMMCLGLHGNPRVVRQEWLSLSKGNNAQVVRVRWNGHTHRVSVKLKCSDKILEVVTPITPLEEGQNVQVNIEHSIVPRWEL